MFDELRSAVDTLEGVVRGFEPRSVDGRGAVSLVELFARIEHLGAAGKALASARVEETGAYREGGHRSAGQLLAKVSGVTVGAAESTLRTVKRLGDLPATDQAFRAGELSDLQAKEISCAASKDPSSEATLLRCARRQPLKTLREDCARVLAATEQDDAAWAQRLHDQRSMYTWNEHGAYRADLTLAPDRAGPFHAALRAETDLLFREARAEGRREPRGAYMADALVNLVARGPRKPIEVRVDAPAAALERGHVIAGESCELDGVGPIPVTVARSMLADARVTLLVRDEEDRISHVSSLTRTIPAKLRRWVEAAYPACGRDGCGNTQLLQIDHIDDYANGGAASEHNIWRLCPSCHALKTYGAWKVIGSPGHWDLVPPDHPDDPDPP